MREQILRRLERERRARRVAEAIAEEVTRQLYDAVQQLQRTTAVVDETTDFVVITDAAAMYVAKRSGGAAYHVKRWGGGDTADQATRSH